MNTKFWVGVVMALSSAPSLVLANISATSLVLKILEVRVSPNDDCSAAVSVYSSPRPDGTPVDFAQNPTLGAGALNNGTYKCVMVHLSDIVTFTPGAPTSYADPNCVTGTAYIQDTLLSNLAYMTPEGMTIWGQGTDPFNNRVEDFPWVYLSTTGSPTDSCASANHRCPILRSPITVSGDRTLTLVWNLTDLVSGHEGHCKIYPHQFEIR